MKTHPKIQNFIDLLKENGILETIKNEKKILLLLKQNGATQTEAVIVLHNILNITIGESEKIVFPSKIWEIESLEDIAYQTFLYMNYNPADPTFYYDEEKVRFSLIPPEKGNK